MLVLLCAVQFLAGAVVFLLPNVAAALQIFLALTGLLVLSHHAVPVRGKNEEYPALLGGSSA